MNGRRSLVHVPQGLLKLFSHANSYLCRKWDYSPLTSYLQTLHDMLSSYLATEEFVGVVKRMQEVFSNEELDARDIISMYKICIHETSVFGTSK